MGGSGGAGGSGDTGGSGGAGGSGDTGGSGGSGGMGGMGGSGPGKIWPACAPAPSDEGDFAPTDSSRLVAGSVTPVGVTSDHYLIYRDGAKLLALKLGAEKSEPSVIAEQQGTVLFRGRMVFVCSNVDYGAGRADLLAFSGPGCVRPIGQTLWSDNRVATSDDGSMLLFPANVTETTFDLEVTARDLSWR
ncbi:MAG TPA: hypothetical protein VFS43_27595 [Polyangiaceae bacterium]|nr:hypothetical protein [Polyangiaceae bacterium]